MVVLSPYPQAAQRFFATLYALLPHRLHFMWLTLPARLPKDGVPFPIRLSPWRWRNQDYVVSSDDDHSELSDVFRGRGVLCLFQNQVQVLVKALKSSAQTLSALQSYEHDLT